MLSEPPAESGEGADGLGGGEGGVGGGGATRMATICVTWATVGVTAETVTPTEARAVVRAAGVWLTKDCALAAMAAAVEVSDAGTVIRA